jgi:hypothetical protein
MHFLAMYLTVIVLYMILEDIPDSDKSGPGSKNINYKFGLDL